MSTRTTITRDASSYGLIERYSVGLDEEEDVTFYLKASLELPATKYNNFYATGKDLWTMDRLYFYLPGSSQHKIIFFTAAFYEKTKEALFLTVNRFIGETLVEYLKTGEIEDSQENAEACQQIIDNVFYLTKKSDSVSADNYRVNPIIRAGQYRDIFINHIQLINCQWVFKPKLRLKIFYDHRNSCYYGENKKIGYGMKAENPQDLQENFIYNVAWKYQTLVIDQQIYTEEDGIIANVLRKRLNIKDIPAKNII